MPKLIYKRININDSTTINIILNVLTRLLNNGDNIFKLDLSSNRVYFQISQGTITRDSGWYIIMNNFGNILYIGTASNLNNRLNSKNGSRDNFANSHRTGEKTRNIIKKFRELGVITELYVKVIPEETFRRKLNIKNSLTKLDRKNIEKILSNYCNFIFKPRIESN